MEQTPSTQVPKVKLGSQGLEVSRLGMGCAGLSGLLNAPLSHEAAAELLQQAFHRGITFFDTANVYGNGESEIMIGKALKKLSREQVQVGTKFGFIMVSLGNPQVCGSPEHVRECIEDSLKRLAVDYVDLYFQHRVDTTVPIEETMGELKKLVEEGKVKYIGLCEANVDTIRRAHAVHPITAVQMEYSLWSREIEEDVIPVCRELGIGIVAYSPLGHGFFTGKGVTESLPSESIVGYYPRFSGENLEKNKVLYAKFAALAVKHSCTPGQLALAWLLHQGDDIVPIPGTTKVKNVEANIGSISVKLTAAEVEEIGSMFPADEVSGHRQFAGFSQFDYREANSPQPEK